MIKIRNKSFSYTSVIVQVGIEAWKNARDKMGLTPYDYATMRGYHSYIQLVQRKTIKKGETHHYVLDIPSTFVDSNTKKKQSDWHRPSSKVSSLQTEKIESAAAIPHHCGQCKLAYTSTKAALVYRPVMLSMVAIAAVCVCVALLFKSSPRVNYVFQPFTWESLDYGSM